MDKLSLSIVTPDGEVFSGDVKIVVLPGRSGEFGVLPKHSSLVTSLNAGVIEFETINDKKEAVTINWGYAEVSEESVIVLADGAVALDLDDKSELRKNIEEAKELLKSASNDGASIASVEAKMGSFV